MSSKFDLMDIMTDALNDFYNKNNLDHCCALESLMVGNYKTTEQREWLDSFSHKWDQLQDEGLL